MIVIDKNSPFSTAYSCDGNPNRNLKRRRIFIDIFQIPPSLSDSINRRLFRNNLPIGILTNLGEFPPPLEIFRVSFVAL